MGDESTSSNRGFKWEKEVERFTTKKIANLVRNGRKGYLLEVDVEYPRKLHEMHNNLPFMPEKMKINKVEKLVPNLCDKGKICGTHQSSQSSAKTWLST